MNYKEFKELIEKKIIPECMEILESKGRAYSTADDDQLGSFKAEAKEAEISIKRLWLIFFNKHYYAIKSFVYDRYYDSEPAEKRITDMINFLFLLRAIIEEKKDKTVLEREKKEGT